MTGDKKGSQNHDAYKARKDLRTILCSLVLKNISHAMVL